MKHLLKSPHRLFTCRDLGSIHVTSTTRSPIASPGTSTTTASTPSSSHTPSEGTKKKSPLCRGVSMNRLEFFDLTNLPLISVLRRHQNVLLLLVNAAAYFKPKQGATQTPVIAKLFPTKQAKLSRRTTLTQLESVKDDDELERTDRAFHRELILLATVHSGPQKNRGVVKLLGWGIAENYSGYLMESIAGPSLGEASAGWCKSPRAGLWKVHPPAHLQLLYRLHWALQLANVVYDLHCRNIVHRDLRVEHFAFRSPPSPVSFGELVLTDLGQARFRKTHVESISKMSSTDLLPTHLELEPSHPCVVLHSDTMMRWRYLAESLIEEMYCDSGPVATPNGGGSNFYGGVLESSAETCMHWPVRPPRVSPPSMTVAPELAFCESNGNCPNRCQADALRQRAALKQRYGHNLAGRCSLTPRGEGELRPGAECKCPICQCHESRCDVWSLGIMLGGIFQVFDSENPRIEECTICGNRKELSGANIDSWLEDVAVLIGAMTIPKCGRLDSSESEFVLKEFPSTETAESLVTSARAVSAQDFFRPKSMVVGWQQSGDCSPMSAKSTQASTPPSHSANEQMMAVNQLLQWQEVGQLVKLKILDLLYWATELDPSKRIKVLHVRDTLEMLFDIVYQFYQELHLPSIYPSRI